MDGAGHSQPRKKVRVSEGYPASPGHAFASTANQPTMVVRPPPVSTAPCSNTAYLPHPGARSFIAGPSIPHVSMHGPEATNLASSARMGAAAAMPASICHVCGYDGAHMRSLACNHCFHGRCVATWPLSSCPVADCAHSPAGLEQLELGPLVPLAELRQGRWKEQECVYTQLLTMHFHRGLLPLARMKLSKFLGTMLHCSSSRLLKRLKTCKEVYQYRPDAAMDKAAHTASMIELSRAESVFLASMNPNVVQSIRMSTGHMWREQLVRFCLMVRQPADHSKCWQRQPTATPPQPPGSVAVNGSTRPMGGASQFQPGGSPPLSALTVPHAAAGLLLDHDFVDGQGMTDFRPESSTSSCGEDGQLDTSTQSDVGFGSGLDQADDLNHVYDFLTSSCDLDMDVTTHAGRHYSINAGASNNHNSLSHDISSRQSFVPAADAHGLAAHPGQRWPSAADAAQREKEHFVAVAPNSFYLSPTVCMSILRECRFEAIEWWALNLDAELIFRGWSTTKPAWRPWEKYTREIHAALNGRTAAGLVGRTLMNQKPEVVTNLSTHQQSERAFFRLSGALKLGMATMLAVPLEDMQTIVCLFSDSVRSDVSESYGDTLRRSASMFLKRGEPGQHLSPAVPKHGVATSDAAAGGEDVEGLSTANHVGSQHETSRVVQTAAKLLLGEILKRRKSAEDGDLVMLSRLQHARLRVLQEDRVLINSFRSMQGLGMTDHDVVMQLLADFERCSTDPTSSTPSGSNGDDTGSSAQKEDILTSATAALMSISSESATSNGSAVTAATTVTNNGHPRQGSPTANTHGV